MSLTPASPLLEPTTTGNSPDDIFLKNIQGNILKSNGRPFTRLVLFWFDPTPRADRTLRKFLRDLIRTKDSKGEPWLTSAYQQWLDSPKRNSNTNRPFYGFGITVSGMMRCDYDSKFWPLGEKGDRHGFAWPMHGESDLFDDVMPAQQPDQNWEPKYQGDGPDGMWLLAHSDPAELDAMQARVQGFLDQHRAGQIPVKIEKGKSWPDAADHKLSREPFGFLDGLSDPVFFKADFDAKVSKWINIPRKQVLIQNGGEHDGGSFMVFRKLEQDVHAFRNLEKAIDLSGLANRPKDAGALLIGRERDGTPLAPVTGLGKNNFDFDRVESRCPFHAHIRKANPRINDSQIKPGDSAQSEDNQLARQFARRSAVYDDQNKLPAFSTADYVEGDNITKDSEVGLLFMAYMSDIEEQFAIMQMNWFGSADFPIAGTGLGDPVLRPLAFPVNPAKPHVWSWAKLPGVKADMAKAKVVNTKGGAHFYVPSMAWLTAQ